MRETYRAHPGSPPGLDLCPNSITKVLSVLANQGGCEALGRWTESMPFEEIPLGTVWGKGGASVHSLLLKDLEHWEMSASVHQANALRKTVIMVSSSRADTFFTSWQRLFPYKLPSSLSWPHQHEDQELAGDGGRTQGGQRQQLAKLTGQEVSH